MVGAARIELATPTMSTWCSPAELRAHRARLYIDLRPNRKPRGAAPGAAFGSGGDFGLQLRGRRDQPAASASNRQRGQHADISPRRGARRSRARAWHPRGSRTAVRRRLLQGQKHRSLHRIYPRGRLRPLCAPHRQAHGEAHPRQSQHRAPADDGRRRPEGGGLRLRGRAEGRHRAGRDRAGNPAGARWRSSSMPPRCIGSATPASTTTWSRCGTRAASKASRTRRRSST